MVLRLALGGLRGRALAWIVVLSLCAGSVGAIGVTTTADENGTGPDCSLREAVTAINTSASFGGCTFTPGDTEVLLPAGTYAFEAGSPEPTGLTLDVPMAIRGAGPELTLLDAAGLYDDPVLWMASGGNVVLEGFTLANYEAADTLPPLYYEGTGRAATLTVRDVAVRDNTARFAGGLRLSGATGDSVTLERVLFENNESLGIGGDVGGAIGCYGLGLEVTIRDSIFRGNRVSDRDMALGGAIYSQGCSLDLENVTFEANRVDGIQDGCPPLARGGVCFPLAAGGGGLAAVSRAGVTSEVRLTNVTFFGNVAGVSSVGAGAAFADNTSGTQSVFLTNVTFAGNSAALVADDLWIEGDSPVVVSNVVFGGSAPGGPESCGLFATLVSAGGNLDTDGSCGLTEAGDQTVADPGIEAVLADHGGFVPTLALRTGSPAIDGGVGGGCPATDGRGAVRPQDGDANGSAVCDSGAFELALIFADGFETGDTSGWTLVAP